LALQLDLALAEFGHETAAARSGMKETLTRVRRMLWWREDGQSLTSPSRTASAS
jgi:hypothetical protein